MATALPGPSRRERAQAAVAQLLADFNAQARQLLLQTQDVKAIVEELVKAVVESVSAGEGMGEEKGEPKLGASEAPAPPASLELPPPQPTPTHTSTTSAAKEAVGSSAKRTADPLPSSDRSPPFKRKRTEEGSDRKLLPDATEPLHKAASPKAPPETPPQGAPPESQEYSLGVPLPAPSTPVTAPCPGEEEAAEELVAGTSGEATGEAAGEPPTKLPEATRREKSPSPEPPKSSTAATGEGAEEDPEDNAPLSSFLHSAAPPASEERRWRAFTIESSPFWAQLYDGPAALRCPECGQWKSCHAALCVHHAVVHQGFRWRCRRAGCGEGFRGAEQRRRHEEEH